MIAIDTQVMIWGFKRIASPDRQHMLAKAAELFSQASERKEGVLVPSLVLSEVLVKYGDADRPTVLAEIGKRFFIAPFDARAAAISALLFADKQTWSASRDATGNSRQCIKVDLSILATVAANGLRSFYVEDGPLFDLGKRFGAKLDLIVKRLPDPQPKQSSIFSDDDLPEK